jgi:hypothetical protein
MVKGTTMLVFVLLLSGVYSLADDATVGLLRAILVTLLAILIVVVRLAERK